MPSPRQRRELKSLCISTLGAKNMPICVENEVYVTRSGKVFKALQPCWGCGVVDVPVACQAAGGLCEQCAPLLPAEPVQGGPRFLSSTIVLLGVFWIVWIALVASVRSAFDAARSFLRLKLL